MTSDSNFLFDGIQLGTIHLRSPDKVIFWSIQVSNLLFHVECIIMPKLYSGRILMNIQCKGQSERSIWSPYTIIIYETYVRKRSFDQCCPVKIQISLRICAGWSESSQGTFMIANDAKFCDNEDTDQTAKNSRLVWVFVGRTCQKVRFLMLRLIRIYTFKNKYG